MNLLNENINDEVGYRSFIDELDSFDEFDIDKKNNIISFFF